MNNLRTKPIALIWLFLALAGISVAAIFPFLFLGRQLLFNLDNVHQTYVWWEYTVREIQSGQIPLWNPYVAGGMSNAAEGQMFVFYPLSAIWILISGSFAGTQTSIVIFTGVHLFLLALGFYSLFKVFGSTRVPALLGSLIGVFVGAFLYRSTSQLNIFWAMSWFPLILASFIYAVRMKRPLLASLSGGLIALSIYAGHFQGAILVVPLMIIFGVVHILYSPARTKEFKNVIFTVAVSGVVACVAALPQLWATLEYMPNALRIVGADRLYGGTEKLPYEVVAGNPHFDFNSFPGLFFSNQQPTLDGSWFIGIPAFLLALVALGSRASARYRELKTYSIISIVAGLVLSLGPNTPALKVWLLIPGISILREPTRYDVWAAIGFIGLALIGVSRLVEFSRNRRWLLAACIFAGSALTLASLDARLILLVLLGFGVLQLSRPEATRSQISSSRKFRYFGIIALLAWSPLFVTWALILPPANAPKEALETPQNTFTESLERLWLSAPDPSLLSSQTSRTVTLTDGVPANSGSLYSRLTTSSYSATTPRGTFELMNSGNQFETSLNLLGVQNVISKNESGVLQFEKREGDHPLAWFVEPELADRSLSVVENLSLFSSPDDVYKKGFVTAEGLSTGCLNSFVESQISTNSAVFETNCNSNGTLFTGIIYDKNWVAETNGQLLPIHIMNSTFIAVEVPPGVEAITLSYRPNYWSGPVVALVLITALGLLIVSMLFLARGMQRPKC